MRTVEEPIPTDSPRTTSDVERRLRLRALRASWVKDVVQALAVTAAGIWALSTFWYRERYLPRITDANVSVRVKLDRLGQKDGVVAMRASILTDNAGQATARVLGLTLKGRGWRATAAPPAGLVAPDAGTPLERGPWTALDRTLATRSEVLFSKGEVYEPFQGGSNTTLRPGGHDETELVFYVSAADFSVVEVEAALAWIPVAFPLRKECYAFVRQPDGSTGLGLSPESRGCRLTTSGGNASVALW